MFRLGYCGVKWRGWNARASAAAERPANPGRGRRSWPVSGDLQAAQTWFKTFAASAALSWARKRP